MESSSRGAIPMGWCLNYGKHGNEHELRCFLGIPDMLSLLKLLPAWGDIFARKFRCTTPSFSLTHPAARHLAFQVDPTLAPPSSGPETMVEQGIGLTDILGPFWGCLVLGESRNDYLYKLGLAHSHIVAMMKVVR